MKIGRQNRQGSTAIIKLKKTTTTSQKFWMIARLVALIALVIWLIWSQSNMVLTKEYIYTSQRVPKTFVGYNIVNVSDIHNSGINVAWAVKNCKPDVIVVSGGLTDSNGGYKTSVKTLQKLANIAPTYYVLGDNDENTRDQIIVSVGSEATLIENDTAIISAPEIDETAFIKKYVGSRLINKAEAGDEDTAKYIEYTKEKLAEDKTASLLISGIAYGEDKDLLVDKIYNGIGTDKSVFQVSIANQSSLFDTISIADIDILFSGETHGVKRENSNYSKGVYANSGTTMFLSSGIGNLAEDKMRLFNYPEIVLVTLSDGTIRNENPLEKILSYFIDDVKTKFDGDEEFKSYIYEYKNGYETN